MPEIVLLGDSVLDNGAYVAPGEPDVPAQLRALLPDWTVEMRAVDGHVAEDVARGLDSDALPEGAAVMLSAGGNDALGRIDILDPFTPTTAVAAFEALRRAREAFRAVYAPLLDRLAGRRVLAATIYDPNFEGPEAALQAAAEGALSAFNDVIMAEAVARGFDVLDLRRIFTEPGDYANPIEPSAAGGAKLAAAIDAWARG